MGDDAEDKDTVRDYELTIPRLEIPPWSTTLPVDQLKESGLPENKIKELVAMDLLNKKLDFLINSALENNRHQRNLERAVIANTKWRRWMTGKIGILSVIGVFVANLLAPRITEAVWPKSDQSEKPVHRREQNESQPKTP